MDEFTEEIEQEEELERCEHCGELHPKSEMQEVWCYRNYEHWCGSCVVMDTFICDDCGDLCDDSDCTEIIDIGKQVCNSCRDKYYYCECCDEYFESETTEINGTSYCDDCRDARFITCDDCGEWIDRDFAFWTDNNVYCDECYRYHISKYIRDYHDAPDIEYYGDYGDAFIGLGVELEVDGGREPDDLISELQELHREDELYYEHDGSLTNYGFEIITQPHTIEAFYKINWEEILDTIKAHGYRSHDTETCGLHVHVSREMFGITELDQDMNIAKVVAFYERNWKEILKLSRRTRYNAARWARRYSDKSNISKEDTEKAIKDRVSDCQARYMAVNLTNEHTVEFRICRGTLDLPTFLSWIDFTLSIVQASWNIDWESLDDLALWFNGLKEETIESMKKQKAFDSYTRREETVCA